MTLHLEKQRLYIHWQVFKAGRKCLNSGFMSGVKHQGTARLDLIEFKLNIRLRAQVP